MWCEEQVLNWILCIIPTPSFSLFSLYWCYLESSSKFISYCLIKNQSEGQLQTLLYKLFMVLPPKFCVLFNHAIFIVLLKFLIFRVIQ